MGTRHITLFVTLFALAGCGADAGDAAAGATVASEHERVTGGTSGDPAPVVIGTQDQPFQGCEFRITDGYTIRYGSQLFDAMDRMRERMKGPRFHHVLITDDVNAAVVQRPAFGLFGWPRN